MVTLSASVAARAQWRDVGRLLATGLAWLLWAAGFGLARTLRAVGMAVAGVFVGIGWLAGRIVWPALCWCGRAVEVGWEEGRKPRRAEAA